MGRCFLRSGANTRPACLTTNSPGTALAPGLSSEALTAPDEAATRIEDPVWSTSLKEGGVRQKGERYEVTASLVRALDGKDVYSAAVRSAPPFMLSPLATQGCHRANRSSDYQTLH